jgi:hypothetical protein
LDVGITGFVNAPKSLYSADLYKRCCRCGVSGARHCITRPIPRKTAERGTVTTKEIPKRELRVWSQGGRYDGAGAAVTTKEIPKRELRVFN